MSLSHCLTVPQRLALVDVIDALNDVRSKAELIGCLDGVLQEILPHECVACGIGKLTADSIQPNHLLLHRFPYQYLENIRRPDGGLDSPVLARWRSTRVPIAINLYEENSEWPPSMIDLARKFEFINLLAHGQVDTVGNIASYFSFHRIPEVLGEKHIHLIQCLAPHLHNSLALVTSREVDLAKVTISEPTAPRLTSRQIEVLRWLSFGKTYWEIGKIIKTTENNVKYHVAQIFKKLAVQNGTSAVVKAMELNLLTSKRNLDR